MSWVGAADLSAKIASALRGFPNLRFEVTEEPSAGFDGQRFVSTPSLGIWRSPMGVFGESFISDEKLRTAIVNATGWSEHVVDAELVGEPSVFFYVFDYDSKWTWMVSVPKKAFFNLIDSLKHHPDDVLVNNCNHSIASCCESNGRNPDAEHELALTISGYFSITRSYQLTQNASKANHFVTIRYSKNDILRPFALAGSELYPLPYESVKDALHRVILQDGANHPEWIS
jgi:hypothetical protein